MTIYAAISAYNDADVLPAALESIKGAVDRIIIVDGAYEGFPLQGGDFKSTDGTLELARATGAVLIKANRIWADQTDKRNRYLQVGQPGDWYLVIDSDERLHNGGDLAARIDIATEGEAIPAAFRLPVVVTKHGKRHIITAPRLLQHHPALAYRHTHDWIWRGDHRLGPNDMVDLRGPWIEDTGQTRTPTRQAAKQAYYRRQFYAERAARNVVMV
jgi:glycosyltransferase involved in cell wall biosynthesis